MTTPELLPDRVSFEDWFERENGYRPKFFAEAYSQPIQLQWIAWQAASIRNNALVEALEDIAKRDCEMWSAYGDSGHAPNCRACLAKKALTLSEAEEKIEHWDLTNIWTVEEIEDAAGFIGIEPDAMEAAVKMVEGRRKLLMRKKQNGK